MAVRRFARRTGAPTPPHALETARRSLPAVEPPGAYVELDGHGDFGLVWKVVPLPCGKRVVIGSKDGKLRVYAAASGALERELDARSVPGSGLWRGPIGVCALGGDVVASSVGEGGKLVTWDAATGARLSDAVARAGVGPGDIVYALASLGDGRFAAGTARGDVVFYAHSGGRGVAEAARVADAHWGAVVDLAACGGRLATASVDHTAAVWGVASRERLATLRGHTMTVLAVDMSDRLVATGSYDGTVRVHAASGRYECVAVLDWLHTSTVGYVEIVGDDVVATADSHVCVTRVSTHAVVARVDVACSVESAAVLADGRLAVGGPYGAALVAPPAAAAGAFEAHGAAAFPRSAAATRAPAGGDPLPPLQASVVRVVAGDLSAAAACRDLISKRACSASLAEWWAAHVLLMRAVQDGDVPAETEYQGEKDWWLRCLYAQASKLAGGKQCCASVLQCARDACTAGVLETTESTLRTSSAQQDFKEVVAVFRLAEEQIVTAVGQVFVRQAETDQRLTRHVAKFKRFRDAQFVSQLVSVVFSVAPFASAVEAGAGGLVDIARGNMEATNVVESLVGIGAGSQAFGSGPFVDRFMRGTRDVLNENVYSAMPEESRQMLDSAIANMALTVDELRALAVSIVEGRTGVDEVFSTGDGAGVGGLEAAAADSKQSDCGGCGGAGDGAASDCAVASVRAGVDGANGLRSGSGSDGTTDEKDAGDGSNAEVGDQSEQTREACVIGELKKLEKKGLEADAVCGMKTEELAFALAGFMVAYDCGMWEQFVEIRVRLTDAFRKQRVHGRRVVGKYAMSVEAFYDVVMDALASSEIGADAETDGQCVREFLDEVCGT